MRRLLVVLVAAAVAATVAGLARADEGVYYQDPVQADMPVAVPPTASCTVTLATDYVTNTSTGAYQDDNGTFAPPAGCPGPWAKVVLHFSATEAGRQYDRAGEIVLGGAWIFFTSTPEPDPDGIAWHVDKDVTEYSSLFTHSQPFTISVPNYLNSTLTGVMHIAASLTFYETDASHPAPPVPDQVIGLGTHYVSSGDPTDFGVSGLPRNLERAKLEVYPKGNSCDEFWYGGAPDAFANANGLCGGGAYRELDAALDGAPAGATLPFPEIFTGGVNPLIWRPIPAVDAFDMPPRTFDLTPFVGSLVDGGTHTISLSVADAQSYWGLEGNLLLWQDAGSTQTSGALTTDTLGGGPAAADVIEQPGSGSDVWKTTAARSYTISGWVQTSHGIVTTTVDRSFSFANGNDLTVQDYRQNTTDHQTIDTVTTTADSSGTRAHEVAESDDVVAQDMFQATPPHSDYWMLPAHVTLTKTLDVHDSRNGATTFSSSLSNETDGSGVLSEYNSGQYRLANGADRQIYDYEDSTGLCYHRRISAAEGWVTSDRLSTTC
jgi:peptide N-acetyl-beta-D-glucosaminyl asparaginase amidase A